MLSHLAARLERGRRVVLATVLGRSGSAPSTPGQKLALLGPDEAIGTVGGGAIELRVLDTMRAMLGERGARSRVERYELGPTLGMCCGGVVEVLLEPLDPALEVLVVGAGHIGAALAPLLGGLGFRVTVCDGREEAFEARGLRAHAALTCLTAEPDDPEVERALGSDRARAAALVMTHDHLLDQAAIEWALRVGFGFVGGVGSRRKAARTRARLAQRGFAAADAERVAMPVGHEIGARSPAEIAVAIAASMIEWRADLLGQARRSGAALRERGQAALTADGAPQPIAALPARAPAAAPETMAVEGLGDGAGG